jgi:poly-gamma-glutamate synthesis protein (capsule biosynthesis protein)
LLVVAAWWFFHGNTKAPSLDSTKSSQAPSKTTAKKDNNKQDNTIRFIATGDMLPHATVNKNAETPSGNYDYLPFFNNVRQYLTSADIAYCNQESPSDPAAPVSGYPTFNAPASFANDLKNVGCNVINLANNHAYDKGQAGINATNDVWRNLKPLAMAGISSSPAQQRQISTFSVKGVKFAFLSYSQCSNNQAVSSYGLNILSKSLADSQIAAARSDKVDMIIAAMHSCKEGSSAEDSWQDQWAEYFAGKGVDIVIGTGPHWLQPVKRLPKAGGGDTVVWFSLGNFLNTQLDVNGLIGGIAVMDIDATTKTVTRLGFMPTYMHYEWTAAQRAADDELARHNLMLYPLDQAATPLARSQNGTTVEVQTKRVTSLMNVYTPVTMLTSKTFLDFPR